jgi:hypothetical protein
MISYGSTPTRATSLRGGPMKSTHNQIFVISVWEAPVFAPKRS